MIISRFNQQSRIQHHATTPPTTQTTKRKRDTLDAEARPSAFGGAAHAGGRTIKRFRDSRPALEEIHSEFFLGFCVAWADGLGNTLDALYRGQRALRREGGVGAVDAMDAETGVVEGEGAGRSQTSLHRFFHSATRVDGSLGSEAPSSPAASSSTCEDVDMGADTGGTGVQMDVDGMDLCG